MDFHFAPIDVKQQVWVFWVVAPEHRCLSSLSIRSHRKRPKAKQKAMWCTGGSSERLIRVFVERVVGQTHNDLMKPIGTDLQEYYVNSVCWIFIVHPDFCGWFAAAFGWHLRQDPVQRCLCLVIFGTSEMNWDDNMRSRRCVAVNSFVLWHHPFSLVHVLVGKLSQNIMVQSLKQRGHAGQYQMCFSLRFLSCLSLSFSRHKAVRRWWARAAAKWKQHLARQRPRRCLHRCRWRRRIEWKVGVDINFFLSAKNAVVSIVLIFLFLGHRSFSHHSLQGICVRVEIGTDGLHPMAPFLSTIWGSLPGWVGNVFITRSEIKTKQEWFQIVKRHEIRYYQNRRGPLATNFWMKTPWCKCHHAAVNCNFTQTKSLQ